MKYVRDTGTVAPVRKVISQLRHISLFMLDCATKSHIYFFLKTKRVWLYQTIYSLIKPFWYNLVWLKKPTTWTLKIFIITESLTEKLKQRNEETASLIKKEKEYLTQIEKIEDDYWKKELDFLNDLDISQDKNEVCAPLQNLLRIHRCPLVWNTR